MNYHSFCSERKTGKSENIWSTGTQQRTMTVRPSCKQSSLWVCIPVVVLSSYSLPNLDKQKKEKRERSEGEMMMEQPLSVLLSKVHQAEKEGSGFGPGYCRRGEVWTHEKHQQGGRCFCVSVCLGCLWPCSCLLYVCVRGWTQSSVSRKRGEPSEGWTGNSNRANFL